MIRALQSASGQAAQHVRAEGGIGQGGERQPPEGLVLGGIHANPRVVTCHFDEEVELPGGSSPGRVREVEQERPYHLDAEPGFLLHFSHEGFAYSLSWLHAAARQFFKAAVLVTCYPFEYQDGEVSVDAAA